MASPTNASLSRSGAARLLAKRRASCRNSAAPRRRWRARGDGAVAIAPKRGHAPVGVLEPRAQRVDALGRAQIRCILIRRDVRGRRPPTPTPTPSRHTRRRRGDDDGAVRRTEIAVSETAFLSTPAVSPRKKKGTTPPTLRHTSRRGAENDEEEDGAWRGSVLAGKLEQLRGLHPCPHGKVSSRGLQRTRWSAGSAGSANASPRSNRPRGQARAVHHLRLLRLGRVRSVKDRATRNERPSSRTSVTSVTSAARPDPRVSRQDHLWVATDSLSRAPALRAHRTVRAARGARH